MFQPLPTTKFSSISTPFAPGPKTLNDYERYETATETRREKQAIVHQAYRTTPLVAPKAKNMHDLPMGSYLRHVQDPNWQKTAHGGATPVVNYAVRRKLEEASRSGPSPPPGVILAPSGGGASKDESVPVFHRQYNSPINMYSPQSVMETMSGQTGIHPPCTCLTLEESILKMGPLLVDSGGGGPASSLQQKSPYRKHVFQDISQSPTYQMIHGGEWDNLRQAELKEHQAVENKVFNVPLADQSGPVNAFGVPRGKITQSGSFNTLRTSLVLGQSDF